jgi:hypothetical protein
MRLLVIVPVIPTGVGAIIDLLAVLVAVVPPAFIAIGYLLSQ